MKTKYYPVPKCGCCEKKSLRIWQEGIKPNNNNDCFSECDTCMEYLCKDCGDVDEETGITTCTNCLQTAAIRKYNILETSK